MADNAVASTSRGEAHVEPAVVTKKPRPKPRKKAPTGLIDAAPSAPPSEFAPSTTAFPSAAITVGPPDSIDSDEEAGSHVLPPLPRRPDSQSPLSDLSDSTGSGPSKSITPSIGRKRLIPEVVITTIPKKRTSSSLIREVEERDGVDRDGLNGSSKGKKRQKKAAEVDYFDGLDEEVDVAPKKGSKGRGKARPKGNSRTNPPPKKAIDNEGFEAGNATGTGGKATTKTKSAGSRKSRVVDSDDELTADATAKELEVGLADGEQVGDSSMAQENAKADGIPQSHNTGGDQENTPPPPHPAKSKSNTTVTLSSVSRKTPVPSSASSFTRLNYNHSLASEEKPMSMAEIIRRANSATGTPSKTKSHLSFMKNSHSALKKIMPLHARRKTPPPLPPKPSPPKKMKKQLELEEKWEEELEETIEGWVALSSQERELVRKQKRDMEMGYED